MRECARFSALPATKASHRWSSIRIRNGCRGVTNDALVLDRGGIVYRDTCTAPWKDPTPLDEWLGLPLHRVQARAMHPDGSSVLSAHPLTPWVLWVAHCTLAD